MSMMIGPGSIAAGWSTEGFKAVSDKERLFELCPCNQSPSIVMITNPRFLGVGGELHAFCAAGPVALM